MKEIQTFIGLIFNIIISHIFIVSQEFARLPRIFYLNDTEECPEDHFYCKVNVKLKPKNTENPPELWELIEKEVKISF